MQETEEDTTATGSGERATRLRKLVGEINGVERVEVDIRDDGSPHIRVWLDGTVSDNVVGEQIQAILESAQVQPDEQETSPARRGGLGRGLDELLAANGDAQPLPHFQPSPEPEEILDRPVHLVLVAVEESAGGVSVRVADSDRAVAFSPVEDTGSLNQAVTTAVARLRQHRPAPQLEGVEVRRIAEESVLSVVLLLEDGRKAAGAEIVQGGLPFTLGRAVWKALAFVE